MGLLDGLKKAIDSAGAQLTSSSQVRLGSSPNPQGIYFTANFQHKAKQWVLSENDALDVYYHGQEVKPGMKARKYNGYELFIYYGHAKPLASRIFQLFGSGTFADTTLIPLFWQFPSVFQDSSEQTPLVPLLSHPYSAPRVFSQQHIYWRQSLAYFFCECSLLRFPYMRKL